MLKTVTIKNGDFYYVVPQHEFSRYWMEHLDPIQLERLPNDLPHNEIYEVEKVPNEIPYVSRLAGLKRGKGIKRVIKSYNQKGSGKHATTFTDD